MNEELFKKVCVAWLDEIDQQKNLLAWLVHDLTLEVPETYHTARSLEAAAGAIYDNLKIIIGQARYEDSLQS